MSWAMSDEPPAVHSGKTLWLKRAVDGDVLPGLAETAAMLAARPRRSILRMVNWYEVPRLWSIGVCPVVEGVTLGRSVEEVVTGTNRRRLYL